MGFFSAIKSFAKPVLSIGGTAVGGAFGGPVGASIGGMAGNLLGGALGGASGAEQAYGAANPEVFRYDPTQFKLGKSGTGQFDLRQSNEARARQMSLADALAARAYGNAPSVADQQAALARQSLFSQGLSSLASQRGGQGAMGQRSLLNALAAGNQGIGAQAGIQRLQEQNLAQQQLADVLQGARGQDITGSQGEFQARIAQLNANKELQAAMAQDAINRSAIRAKLAPSIAESRSKEDASMMGAIGAVSAPFIDWISKKGSSGDGNEYVGNPSTFGGGGFGNAGGFSLGSFKF